jgi:hypothetical protein
MRWFLVFVSTIIVWIYVTVPDVRRAIHDQTAATISQPTTA